MHPTAQRTVYKHDRSPDKLRNGVEPRVREYPHNNCPGERNSGDKNANSPLFTVDTHNAEGSTAEECNDDLAANHDAVDPDEEPVPVQARQYIKFVVQAPIVELVEYLHPDEGVEDDRTADVVWVVEELLPGAKVQD